jgi:ABC-2 type transport system ATP-binding protein
VETFRRRLRCVVLRFSGTPPALPAIPGLLQSFATEKEVALTIANYDDGVRRQLEALPVEQITDEPLGLEDAFIRFVSERGARTFFLDGVGAKS